MKFTYVLILLLTFMSCDKSKSPNEINTNVDENIKSNALKIEATCNEDDDLKWWENTYLFLVSGASDIESEAFNETRIQYEKETKQIDHKCERLTWLKQKSCALWEFLSDEQLKKCLSDSTWKNEVEQNHEYFFGG